MSHVTHTEGVFRNGAYKWVMSRVPMTAIIWALSNFHFDESCHTYRWVMSTYEWVVSHTSKRSLKMVRVGASCHLQISHKSGMNKSRLIYKWAMSHVWMSHVSHVNESCHLRVIHASQVSHAIWDSYGKQAAHVARPLLKIRGKSLILWGSFAKET